MEKKNKKIIIAGIAILAVLMVVFAVIYSVSRPGVQPGSKKIVIEVIGKNGAEEEYKLYTDADYLKQAMDELMAEDQGFSYSGSEGEYGLMVEYVNQERAIYAKDHAYWSIYVNGSYGQYGIDAQPVSDGDKFSWIYEAAK